ncbi:MAG: cytochrome c biogenesis protein ResB [Verrucomicrobiota bacterium]|jgi:hypothetical protein
MNRFVKFFGSLRLTLVCLCLALVLVFVGTLAQVQIGLYAAQSEFFRSFLIFWTPPGAHWRIPVFPGGWTIGGLLLVNLLCAHIQRFQFSRRKIGLLLIHAGLILLLGGFFLSELLRTESQMRIAVGQTANFAEDSTRNELVVLDVTHPDQDKVFAVPQAVLEQGGEIRPPGLPFALRVKHYLPNSQPAGPMSGDAQKLQAANGLGQRLLFNAAPLAGRRDDENKPAALIQVLAGQQVVGDWTVSTWLTKRPWSSLLQEQFGQLLGARLDAPQSFTWAGRLYQIALRPVRYYKPCAITLLEFKHEVYAGTDIPSDFSSRIHLKDPARGEDRDVLIRMNSPLRYGGDAYYQSSFEQGDKVTILEVVHNPAAITPYLACLLVAAGLGAQFLTHLFAFARKQARPAPRTSAPSDRSDPSESGRKPSSTPALALERSQA